MEFVNLNSHTYTTNPEVAEESGTPNILGDIRAGLVFKVKQFCQEEIDVREKEILAFCNERFSIMKNI